MTPPSLSSIAPPATHYTSPLHGGDSCREAGLHVPILIGVILVLALLAGTRNLVLLTHIFWALTLLGWVPVAVGFAIKMRNRVLSRWRWPLPAKRNTGPERLPFITILLPVMGEAGMMSQLAAAMARLDYPADRLDCMVLLEAVDRTTPVAAMATQWPDFCRLVTVPIGAPQTKARACNYALRRARGDLLVIFDAEDQPHPKQLREAARRFARHDENLACLQAPLHITPKKAGWLENQFALEYGLLFNFILPCLGRANGALPLGGSSNYFRLSSLRAVGGWDDYNLTEDADLGMRLG